MRPAASIIVLALLAAGDPSASTVTVRAGEDLQQALNGARPGDTILLERGATFVGNFVLPARIGTDSRPVTVRTAGDGGFPGEGERMTPEQANELAKLRSPSNQPVLRTAAATHSWNITLIEFQANRNGLGDIITLGDGSTAQNSLDRVPSDLRLDRLYIHGDPAQGQKRGIALNSARTMIIGCYIADIKAIGQDSQAIAGWNGPGPYVIENNYLEAAGENLLFGGADPAIIGLTPSDITVRGNTLSKPLAWHEQRSPQWQVKNLLELKNARNVVIERNLLERSWSQAQAGYAVLFTVRNQDGGCAWCQVEDVKFRKNVIRDMAAGVQILGSDTNYASRQTNGIVISDNLFDGIDRQLWGGDGYLMQLSDAPRDLVFDHNTVIQKVSGGLVKIANGVTTGFVFTNNVTSHGNFGIIGADRGVGNDSIGVYLPGAKITSNVMAGGVRSRYPPGNLFPSAEELMSQFVNPRSGDYNLVASSSWRRAGTDGKDLGADLDEAPRNLFPRGTPLRVR